MKEKCYIDTTNFFFFAKQIFEIVKLILLVLFLIITMQTNTHLAIGWAQLEFSKNDKEYIFQSRDKYFRYDLRSQCERGL